MLLLWVSLLWFFNGHYWCNNVRVSQSNSNTKSIVRHLFLWRLSWDLKLIVFFDKSAKDFDLISLKTCSEIILTQPTNTNKEKLFSWTTYNACIMNNAKKVKVTKEPKRLDKKKFPNMNSVTEKENNLWGGK